MHPGGKRNIMKGAFKDASKEFHQAHKGMDISKTPLVLLEIGELKVCGNRTIAPAAVKEPTQKSSSFRNEETWLVNKENKG